MREVSSSRLDVMSAASFDPSKCVPAHLVLSADERAETRSCPPSASSVDTAGDQPPNLRSMRPPPRTSVLTHQLFG